MIAFWLIPIFFIGVFAIGPLISEIKEGKLTKQTVIFSIILSAVILGIYSVIYFPSLKENQERHKKTPDPETTSVVVPTEEFTTAEPTTEETTTAEPTTEFTTMSEEERSSIRAEYEAYLQRLQSIDEYDAIHDIGYDDGREAGYEEGYRDGYEDGYYDGLFEDDD